MDSENHHTSLEQLFVAALGVLNRTLDKHRESAPCQQILAECTEKLQDRRLGAQLHVDSPTQPVVHFAVRFHNGLFEPVSAGWPAEGRVWTIGVEELKEIVAGESEFVGSPHRFPWDGLAAWTGGATQPINERWSAEAHRAHRAC